MNHHIPQSPFSSPFYMELDAQRLNKLNHFRAAFDSGREIDAVYYPRFTALVESVNTADLPETLREQAATLITAGRMQNAQKIRKTLPAFCEALQSKAALQNKADVPPESEIVDGILQRLENTLREGDIKTAGKIVSEMGALKLKPEERELYFKLYDLLMEDKTQEALERIEEWLKY